METRKKGGISMSQVNHDFGQNNLEQRKIDQLGSASSDRREKLMLKKAEVDSIEWNRVPAELYGCLCHKPE